MIKDIRCKDITAKDREMLVSIFNMSFTSTDPETHIENYLKSVDFVLLYFHKGKPIVFLFYQLKTIGDVTVLHLSLSGKCGFKKGVQKNLGAYLYFHIVAFSKNMVSYD